MVKDINSGSNGGSPGFFTAIGNTLFPSRRRTNGYELWKSDGTASGTVMVKDICSGSSGSSPNYLTAVGNTLYFRATDGTNGGELWKSDGTASGTVMVRISTAEAAAVFPTPSQPLAMLSISQPKTQTDTNCTQIRAFTQK